MPAGAPIEVAERADGTVLYHLPFAPSDLPPVFNRDLHEAWDAVRGGGRPATRRTPAGRPGAVRLFRFAGHAVLALSDRDARSWAAAIDRRTGLHTAYGVSLLLRLLSLIDLMAREPALHAGRTAQPSPALLRAASTCHMTGTAQLDETRLRHALAPHGVPA